MRTVVAIAAVTLLLVGVVAPHHHATPGSAHDCMACTVGGALEARDATPTVTPPPPVQVAVAAGPATEPATGFPLGAVPGQSPPLR